MINGATHDGQKERPGWGGGVREILVHIRRLLVTLNST